jgi:CO/xanthine dehydrogenase FAD-binding subunit
MILNSFQLHQPETIADTVNALKEYKGSRLLAGGTFLINQLKQLKKKGLKTPEHIISIDRVKELRGLEDNKDAVVIKPMSTIAECAENKNLDFLKQACQNIGTTPIRNMATIGGNLTCRYTWSELPAVMIACEAALHFTGADEREEILTAEEFYAHNAKTDKILTQISIAKDSIHQINYQRVKKTLHLDVPILAVCINANYKKNKFADIRVAVNTGNQFAQRDKILEQFLHGKGGAGDAFIRKALENVDPHIISLLKDEYKEHMYGICIKNALNEIIRSAK